MKLLYYKNDIYYINPTQESSPKVLYIDNKKLTRLLNFIYIPLETEKLSKEQIISINKLRYIHKNDDEIYSLNSQIKLFFVDIIKYLQIDNLLDFGCGYDPIINYLDIEINFVAFDIDDSLMPLLEDNITISNNLELLKDNTFDLIISIFVFHFEITMTDIKKLYTILVKNGIIIANIYNRDDNSRHDLYLALSTEGFKIRKLSLFSKKNHELWLISKSEINSNIINDIIKISKKYW